MVASRMLCWCSQAPTPIASAAAPPGDWFNRNGSRIRCPKLALSHFGSLRGLVATKDIAPGEEFVSIGFDDALVVQPMRRCPFPDDFCAASYWKRSPWSVKLALLLLFERSRGEASRVANYVQDLEAIEIETPVTWEDSELQQLHYPSLVRKVQQQREEWRELYSKLAASAPGGSAISEADFLWALQAVRSRSFSGPYAGPRLSSRAALAALLAAAGLWSYFVARLPLESLLNAGISAILFNILYDLLLSRKLFWFALLPVIDYCNHSSQVESTVAFEYFGERFTACHETGVQQGQQVLINYGPDSNDLLLQFFGFTESQNPHDRYVLLGTGEQLPAEVLLVSDGLAPETEAWASEQRLAPAAFKAAVLKACKAEKAAWPTTREEDERLLARLVTDGRPRLAAALQFRIAKKALLESAVKALR